MVDKENEESEEHDKKPLSTNLNYILFDDSPEFNALWSKLSELGQSVLTLTDGADFEGLKISTNEFLQGETNLKKCNWNRIFTIPIIEAQDHTHIGTPLKIVAYITEMKASRPVYVGPKHALRTSMLITLTDRSGRSIKCFPVMQQALREKIIKHASHKKYFVFHGTIYPKFVGDKTSLYMFSIRDIQEHVTADDLISVRPDPNETAQKLFNEISRKPDGVLNYIKKSLVSNLHISGLNNAPELNKCIDFIILQSFSDGSDGNHSLKLHSLVIGPPANGKKLLVDIARILNPVFEHVSAVDGKITQAGLVGRSTVKHGESISVPGYIPRASGGVLAIEDFHSIKQNRNAILAAFGETMEDGTVTDSTSAKTKHDANTSLHIDMNRPSQVDISTAGKIKNDIKIFLNILSRIDFIMDIPQDRQRQIEISLSMIRGKKKVNTYAKPIDEVPWIRQLKRIVAYLRTYYCLIEITDEISEYITTQYQKVIEENKKFIETTKYFTFQANATRMINSIEKMCIASARAHCSLRVSKNDVDVAFYFLREKVAFLQNYEKILSEDSSNTETLSESKKRHQAIKEQFGGKTVRTADILTYISQSSDTIGFKSVEPKTVFADLKAIAVSVKKGWWAIPQPPSP